MTSARTTESAHPTSRSDSHSFDDGAVDEQEILHWMAEDRNLRGDYDRYPDNIGSSHSISSRKPLVEYCTNEWQTSPSHLRSEDLSPNRLEDTIERIFNRCIAILKAPKIRRHLIFSICVSLLVYSIWKTKISPSLAENRALIESLSTNTRLAAGGVFGTNLRPSFPHIVQVRDLDEKLVPKARAPRYHSSKDTKRIVFVGDVHGCKEELVALLQKIRFNSQTDHLITTGDLINKGPDSLGVIDLVREVGGSCVRGNNEDRVLLIAHDLNSTVVHKTGRDSEDLDHLNEASTSQLDSPDRALAASLSPGQLSYLQSCPVILRVGFMKPLGGDIVVVHAGLVPGLPLETQDPAAVMNMRAIDLDTHVPSKDFTGGVHWVKLWNAYQRLLPQQYSPFPSQDLEEQKKKEAHTTVVYGHDSKRGLQLSRYTKGIDTGCVSGGRLTALVLADGGRMQVHQVKCKDYRPRKPLKAKVGDVLRDGSTRARRVVDEPEE